MRHSVHRVGPCANGRVQRGRERWSRTYYSSESSSNTQACSVPGLQDLPHDLSRERHARPTTRRPPGQSFRFLGRPHASGGRRFAHHADATGDCDAKSGVGAAAAARRRAASALHPHPAACAAPDPGTSGALADAITGAADGPTPSGGAASRAIGTVSTRLSTATANTSAITSATTITSAITRPTPVSRTTPTS